MDATDVRVAAPICTPAEVAGHVKMPRSTVYSWLRPTPTRPALIHHVQPEVRGWPSIPLIGLAEAFVLRALRDQGMKMPQIAAAVEFIRSQEGEYALGHPDLVHDGITAMLRSPDGHLETLLGGQGVFPEFVQQRLSPFRLAPDGFVEAFLVPRLQGVEIDPRFSSGRMRFTRTGVPIFAISGLLEAGDPPEVVADEFNIDLEEVELVKEHLQWVSQVA